MRTFIQAVWIRLLRRARAESGFTLIEVMVAMGLLLTAVLALAYTATIGFSSIGLARQRQGANGLANQTMEEVRSLPFNTIAVGLSNLDLSSSSDPNITKLGGTPPVYCYSGEQIPNSATPLTPAQVPLVPHQFSNASTKVGVTQYSVSTYVTYYNSACSSTPPSDTSTFRVTVVVTWANPVVRGVASKTQTQSVFFGGSGCESTSTHPFASPCQPFFYGHTGIDDGNVVITGSMQTLGTPLDHASLWVPGSTSDAQLEQIVQVQGTAQTSGIGLQLQGQSETDQGHQQATSGADNDPSQPEATYNSNSTPAQSVQTLAASGAQNSLTLTSSAGDTATTTSTTSASVSPPHQCPNIVPIANQIDSLPCGGSTAVAGGTETAVLAIHGGPSDLGSATLVSLSAPATALRAITNWDLAPEATACTGTSGDGCMRSEGYRAFGTATLGGLPSNLGATPPGWAGYLISLTGYTDSASAEAGVSTTGPAVSANGVISYWNGAGYSTLVINCPTVATTCNSQPISIPEVIVTSGPATVDIVSNLSTGGTTKTCTPAPVPCTSPRASALAQVASPIAGTITYTVQNGGTQAALTLTVNLGTLQARSSYQPAPAGT